MAIAIGFWLVFFLTFIAPFDIIELNITERFYLIPPYAIFFIISYFIAFRFQLLIFSKKKTWNLFFEIIIVALTCFLNYILTYFYYTSSFLNGDFSLYLFTKLVYSPIVILISSLLILGRLFISKKINFKIESQTPFLNKVIIRGDSKNDTLLIEPDKIIAINSAQNYVEVLFKTKDEIQKHLIRSSFKNIACQLPFMIQTHRTHCINPSYLSKWVDNKTLLVDQIEIPVSKTYKSNLENIMNSIPK